MGKRILFLVDHKHRDLPSLSLIGFLLKEKGHEIKYSTLGNEEKEWIIFNPHIVVANKQIGDNIRLKLCKAYGIKRTVINTEGARRKGRLLAIEVPPELIFYWNEDEHNRYSHVPELKNVQHELVGSPRIDFLTEPFNFLFPSKKEMLKKLGMNQDNFTITLATHTVAAFHSPEMQEFKRKQLKEVFNISLDYDTIYNNSVENLKVTIDFLRTYLLEFPELNFIIKPHPNEDITFWKDLVEKKMKLPNLKLVLGMTINELLTCSDLHIAHNGCTTTAEALIKQIPTIEILSENYEKIFPKDRMVLANYKVWSHLELKNAIETELQVKQKGNLEQYLCRSEIQEYIYGNFYKTDGLRCFNHFKVLNRFAESVEGDPKMNEKLIKRLKKERNHKFLQYGIRYELGALKQKLFPKKTNSEVKVDNDPRGRFDNLIKNGDENFWFEKFEKAGFSITFFEELEKSSQN